MSGENYQQAYWCPRCGGHTNRSLAWFLVDPAQPAGRQVFHVGDEGVRGKCWPHFCLTAGNDGRDCERHRRHGIVVAAYKDGGAWMYVFRDTEGRVEHLFAGDLQLEPLPQPPTLEGLFPEAME